jgi:Transposase DNA-binding/Transposase Tn5 dimerisation domain
MEVGVIHTNSVSTWINSEFLNVDFGDKRLDERFKKISIGLSEQSEKNISSSFDSWKEIKACYRFFSNEMVTAEKMLQPHKMRTVDRIKECSRVLLIQDTLVLSYSNRPQTKNLGLCSKHYSSSTPAKGLISHGLLAISDKGVPLGVLGQKFVDRKTFKENGRLTKQQYQRLPIEKKESIKWVELIKECTTYDFGKTQTIHVADREGDIYELYRDCLYWNENFLIRASHNRRINKKNRRSETDEKLFEVLENCRSRGTLSVKVASSQIGRKYREAKLSIVYKVFSMPPPPNRTKNNCNNNMPMLEVTAIMAVEKKPPKGETQLRWVLLTNLPVNSFEEAVDKVKLYSMRWNIELLHKIIKSGFNVEKAQLRDANNLKKYAVLTFILAWRIFWITRYFEQEKEKSCEKVLNEYEWKILYKKFNRNKPIPNVPPSIKNVYIWIAKLGGFIGRKGDGNPGIVSMWRGWNRFIDLLDDYKLFCG